jgi:hypothetical protein
MPSIVSKFEHEFLGQLVYVLTSSLLLLLLTHFWNQRVMDLFSGNLGVHYLAPDC